MLGTKHSEGLLLLLLPILFLLHNKMKYFHGSQYSKVEAMGISTGNQQWELVTPNLNVSFAAAESRTPECTFPNLESGILILLSLRCNDIVNIMCFEKH